VTGPAELRIVVADDHPLYRRGLATLLDAQPGWTVVAQADTGLSAVTAAAEHMPDIVVMDLNMPELDGVEATRRVITNQPSVAVLILTMFDDDDSVFTAMRAGARGYLLKGADQAEIVRAVTAIGSGEAIFGPTVAQRIVEFFAAPRPAHVAPVFPELTAREHEVLDLIAAGRSNADIAATLVLSHKTVRNHVSNIFTKLRVADRATAIVRAREAGLGT
jgi:DNA-binding NarL/FixJ family response regulator